MASIKDRINSSTNSVINGKSNIARAITDKGVTTASNATFEVIENNIRSISQVVIDGGSISVYPHIEARHVTYSMYGDSEKSGENDGQPSVIMKISTDGITMQKCNWSTTFLVRSGGYLDSWPMYPTAASINRTTTSITDKLYLYPSYMADKYIAEGTVGSNTISINNSSSVSSLTYDNDRLVIGSSNTITSDIKDSTISGKDYYGSTTSGTFTPTKLFLKDGTQVSTLSLSTGTSTTRLAKEPILIWSADEGGGSVRYLVIYMTRGMMSNFDRRTAA